MNQPTEEQVLEAELCELDQEIAKVVPLYLQARKKLSKWNLELGRLINAKHEIQRELIVIQKLKPKRAPERRRKEDCAITKEEMDKIMSSLSAGAKAELHKMLTKGE